jgi:formylglycine-generating enzyme required for sulfatase activity
MTHSIAARALRPTSRGAVAALLGIVGLCSIAACSAPEATQAWQDAKPAQTVDPERTVTLPGGLVEIEMVKIPAGTLERDGIRTEIPSFYMSRTEVTWDAYDVLVFRFDLAEEQRVQGIDGATRPTKPYILVDRGFGHAGYPALSMSQAGAQAFCDWLSAHTGRRFRLPSVDQWEYAARAGSATPYACGDVASLDAHAWWRDNSSRKTHEVAGKSPNAWGLFDMHGNVAEWALDAAGKGVVCGGSFRDAADKVGADARREPLPAWNASDPQMPKSVWWLADANFVGFRVICDGTAVGPAPVREEPRRN